MSFCKQLLFCILLLGIILGVETYTNLDLYLQDRLFDFAKGEWMVNREEHRQLSMFFYMGIKNLVIITGLFCLLTFVLSFKYERLKPYRRGSILMFLSIVFVPLVVAGSKSLTNVYCPIQLKMYGGDKPFVRILQAYPEWYHQLKAGRCFPAGHATVGFSLMMAYFVFSSQRKKLIALCAAITIGWITGIYQMMRGEHFLSHTLFSMTASWMVIIIINKIVTRITANAKNH